MTPSTHEWTLLGAKAIGPLMAVFAFVLAARGDLGIAGGVIGGLVLALVGVLHMLIAGVAMARQAMPVKALLGVLWLGVSLMGVGWVVPVAGSLVAPQLGAWGLFAAFGFGPGLCTAGALLATAGAGQLGFLAFVARAPELSDEAW
jgi:hypothetical protein